jgi:hypothetical protein
MILETTPMHLSSPSSTAIQNWWRRRRWAQPYKTGGEEGVELSQLLVRHIYCVCFKRSAFLSSNSECCIWDESTSLPWSMAAAIHKTYIFSVSKCAATKNRENQIFYSSQHTSCGCATGMRAFNFRGCYCINRSSSLLILQPLRNVLPDAASGHVPTSAPPTNNLHIVGKTNIKMESESTNKSHGNSQSALCSSHP